MASILDSIKKMLGIDPVYTEFDSEIIVNINSVFFTLKQLGVGPTTTFAIADKNDVWADFSDTVDLEAIKMYIYLKVRLGFDPPSSSFVLASIENQIKELEFRLNVESDIPVVIVEEEEE